jgi:hypothetical protein
LDEIDSQSEDRMILFPLVHAAGDPEASAARADVRRLLDQAIDELPEAFRLVFVLRQIEQLSVAAWYTSRDGEDAASSSAPAPAQSLGDTFLSVVNSRIRPRPALSSGKPF